MGLLKAPVANQRFEVVAIDLFGPLPVSEEGFQWIFICEDVSSKWVEMFSLTYATAEVCAKCFIDEIVLRFGTPRRVIFDNGPQFVGALMQQVSYCLGFDQSLTLYYNP